jgi:mono/diheme cytochrome c family protein
MAIPHVRTRTLCGVLVALLIGLGIRQGAVAFADTPTAPTPNALAPNPIALLAPVSGVDISGAGPASAIHGNPVAGATKFRANCASCHGERGVTGIDNPGSDDGSVPTLHPIDPGFVEDANGDAAVFAHDIDLFVQHGSRPAGPKPLVSMTAFGDHKLLSQADIADIEAFVMGLNGVFWPDRCPGIQVDLANPSPGSRVEAGHFVVEGRASDARAVQGSGIDHVDIFLDSRESGGKFVGTTTVGTPTDPTQFKATVNLPNLKGGHDLIAYAYSSVRGQVGVASVPIALGVDPAQINASTTGSALTCTP